MDALKNAAANMTRVQKSKLLKRDNKLWQDVSDVVKTCRPQVYLSDLVHYPPSYMSSWTNGYKFF